MLGGSSSINGMIYIRGHARDYDMWRQLGLEGWGFSDVLPYFRRAEGNENGDSAFHGGDGPLGVSNPRKTNVLFEAFVEGRQAELGHPYTDDFNGPQQEGVGPYQLTIKNGQRCSAAKGYLTPALDRPNLTVEVEALTSRILFDGKKAVGVEYTQKGEKKVARATREIVLSGGAVNSPQVLLLSGIGKGEYLRKFGIDVVADLPGVGQNLQDHLDSVVLNECTQPITLHSQVSNPLKQIMTGMQYTFFKSGLATSNGLESGAFLKTRPELEIPDIQLHFVAAMMRDHARVKSDRHGFTVHICQLRPESKGYVALKSLDPGDHALIQPNYLAAEYDRKVMRDGIKMVRNIIAQRAMDPLSWPRILARCRYADRCRDRCLDPRNRRDDLSPGRDREDGHRSDGGGRRQMPRSWVAGPACCRRLGDADAGWRQHKCADDHDRGKDFG